MQCKCYGYYIKKKSQNPKQIDNIIDFMIKNIIKIMQCKYLRGSTNLYSY